MENTALEVWSQQAYSIYIAHNAFLSQPLADSISLWKIQHLRCGLNKHTAFILLIMHSCLNHLLILFRYGKYSTQVWFQQAYSIYIAYNAFLSQPLADSISLWKIQHARCGLNKHKAFILLIMHSCLNHLLILFHYGKYSTQVWSQQAYSIYIAYNAFLSQPLADSISLWKIQHARCGLNKHKAFILVIMLLVSTTVQFH